MAKKNPPINNPLEAAKAFGPDDPELVAVEGATPEPEPPPEPPAEPSESTRTKVKKEKQEVVVPGPVSDESKEYRVIENKRVFLRGQEIQLKVGKILRESSYDPGVLELFMTQGAKLERIK